MASLFSGKKHLTGKDLIKELKSMYSSTKEMLREFEDRFDLFAKFIERAEKDSAEFVCQSCKGKSGGVASRTTVLTKEDDARQIAELKQDLTKKDAEIKQLNKQLSEQESMTSEILSKHHAETKRLQDEKGKQTETLKVLEAKSKELNHLTTEINRLREQYRESERVLNCKESENTRLLQEIQQLRQKFRKRIVVNTHTTLNASLSSQAVGELMTNLSTHLQTDGVEMDQRKYTTGTECTGPVVAICINVSRLGTDVQEVLKHIKKDQHDIAVLVLHHKEAHALPNQNSDRILTGSEYKKLGAIIDVAFLSNKGMYPCEMNSIAMQRLVSFLLQYKTDLS